MTQIFILINSDPQIDREMDNYTIQAAKYELKFLQIVINNNSKFPISEEKYLNKQTSKKIVSTVLTRPAPKETPSVFYVVP